MWSVGSLRTQTKFLYAMKAGFFVKPQDLVSFVFLGQLL